ncbi:hypothetical protein LguiB_020551 [Lonicera macranthoides]
MYDHSLRYCSLHYDIDTFEEFVELDLPHITKENRYIRIAGTCNGLVCLYDLNEYIVALWNPSLKKSIILPKPCVVRKSCDFYHIGFGIDHISNDYKIVRLANTYLILDGVLELLTLLEVELFELSTSSWRNINVVSFDMRNDTLGVVMAPPCAQNSQDWCACIILFGESLSIFHRDVDHSCCLWVMKEYGVGSSWMKQFTIDLGKRSVGRPLCCSKNGDILLEKRNWDYLGRDLVSYDPKTKLIKNLEIHVPASLYLDIYEYKESLVLTKSLNDLWRKENVVACQGTPVLPREDDEGLRYKNHLCFGVDAHVSERLHAHVHQSKFMCLSVSLRFGSLLPMTIVLVTSCARARELLGWYLSACNYRPQGTFVSKLCSTTILTYELFLGISRFKLVGNILANTNVSYRAAD